MAAIDDLTAFAQDVYLVIKNRRFDDITGTDGQVFLDSIVSWVNMFLDELESETGPDDKPIDWTWARENGANLGRARLGRASIDFDTTDFLNLITEEGRYVQILQDNAVISNWAVVAPGNITNKADRVTEDMCALVGETIAFSRAFKDTEDGGTIIGDVTAPLPRISRTNVDILITVKPKLLLTLGVAKNATLPDIVQGGLSPSYAQKYNSLLKAAIARSIAASANEKAQRDSYGGVGGVY